MCAPSSDLPAIEHLFPNAPTIYSSLGQVPRPFEWTGAGAVPELGEHVQVRGWGECIVLGFLVKDGFLGLWAVALAPPAALVAANHNSAQGDVYGRELIKQ